MEAGTTVKGEAGTFHADKPDTGVVLETLQSHEGELIRVFLASTHEQVWVPADSVEVVA